MTRAGNRKPRRRIGSRHQVQQRTKQKILRLVLRAQQEKLGKSWKRQAQATNLLNVRVPPSRWGCCATIRRRESSPKRLCLILRQKCVPPVLLRWARWVRAKASQS